jgi:hypothetical protein
MPLPEAILVSRCNIFRPFTAPFPMLMNVRCRLIGVFGRGRAGLTFVYTHLLEVQPDIDIRDGCNRAGGSPTLAYSDGDKVQITIGATLYTFVVVWVEVVNADTPREFKRAYLLRA